VLGRLPEEALMRRKRSGDYRKILLKDLRDAEYASEYLRAALEEDDAAVFLLALKDVVDARGGMSKLARDVTLQREGLYKMLSERGNPGFENIQAILRALGFELDVRPTEARA
jgi:probable addiction module antidote protein